MFNFFILFLPGYLHVERKQGLGASCSCSLMYNYSQTPRKINTNLFTGMISSTHEPYDQMPMVR